MSPDKLASFKLAPLPAVFSLERDLDGGLSPPDFRLSPSVDMLRAYPGCLQPLIWISHLSPDVRSGLPLSSLPNHWEGF